VDAQILSPVASAEGKLASDTQAFFIGQTTLEGSFQGYPVESFLELPVFESIQAFPLLGHDTITDIDIVKIVDLQIFETVSDFGNITAELHNITQFSNVSLITDGGLFLLGVSNGSITAQSHLESALTGVASFEMSQQTIPFLVVLTDDSFELTYTGGLCPLIRYPTETLGTIRVEDADGTVLWDDDPTNMLFLIDDADFDVTLQTPLSLFPLYTPENQTTVMLDVSPADSAVLDLSSLIGDASGVISDLGAFNIPDLSSTVESLDMILSTATSVLNGAMVLVESHDEFRIDDTVQSFTGVGFARANSMDVTITTWEENYEVQVAGSYRLIFLGDHLYTAQAKDSDTGVAFPIPIVAVWVLALGLFLLFWFYIKKEVNPELDEKMKQYALYFHIATIVIAFILMDREISSQFGISAIDAVLLQGLSLVLGVFIALELLLWILGYFLLSLPVRIIAELGLKFIGIGKGGKHYAKGIGVLFIWVFAAFYVKLIVNLALSFIGPENLFPMG
jgi:hypothetical protein